MRTNFIRILKPLSYWLTIFAITGTLFYWETGNFSKALTYAGFSASIKAPAISLVTCVLEFIGKREKSRRGG